MKELTLEDMEKAGLFKSVALSMMKTDDDYRKLRSQFHPDRYPFNSPEQARAERVFKKLEQLWELVQEPEIIIESKTAKYVLGDKLGQGDVSDTYRASSNGCHDFVVKVSRVKGGDTYISKESQYLRKVLSKAAGDAASYANYFPRLIDSFLWKDGFQKRVNVFNEPHRLWSLDEVLKQKGKLDPRHVCWIFRRLLTGVGFSHLQGVIHGAVLPQHILIEPESHGVCLCGWIHAAEPGLLITTVPQSHKDWYPREVTKHEYAGPETDIYLAARSMLAAGDWGTNTTKIERFLKSLTLDSWRMRPSDAWRLEEDFTKLMDSVYGVRRFIPLVLN